MAVWKWPAPNAALSWPAACETATTKHRSKRSSSGVEARCSSSMSRGPIGSTRSRCLVMAPAVAVRWSAWAAWAAVSGAA